MATTEKKPLPTKVITEKVRASYAYVFTKKPAQKEGDSSKYSVQLLISKKHQKITIAAMEKAIQAAIEIGKVKFKWSDKFTTGSKFKMPLRDGDEELEAEEKKDEALYKGIMFVNASSVQKPQIIDKDKTLITDSTEFKSGDYCRASLNFYPFSANGSFGIACGLNNIQKVATGEALGGRADAVDEFDEFEDDDEV